jgi:RNA 3'-terminal phosphate cyclase (ATP)
MKRAVKREPLLIDGAYGEGGGQILRTALTLSAISGRPIHIQHIRAARRRPGLAAQHLSAVRAVAAICGAQVTGDTIGSTTLDFTPETSAAPGAYTFDVGQAREGGSAGAIMLILQSIMMPLALAAGDSRVDLHGGTHVSGAPTFDYVREVWLHALTRLGIQASIELDAWGWLPVGKGHVHAQIRGIGGRAATLRPLELTERGPLLRIAGRAVAANLPSHIPERMADRARSLLAPLGAPAVIYPVSVQAACSGAGLFLTAEYENVKAGFSAFGKIGKSSEQVAIEVVDALLKHHASDAALDRHLGDQMLLPLALAGAPSHFTVEKVSLHLATNAWVIERFGAAEITCERALSGTGRIAITPLATA